MPYSSLQAKMQSNNTSKLVNATSEDWCSAKTMNGSEKERRGEGGGVPARRATRQARTLGPTCEAAASAILSAPHPQPAFTHYPIKRTLVVLET